MSLFSFGGLKFLFRWKNYTNARNLATPEFGKQKGAPENRDAFK